MAVVLDNSKSGSERIALYVNGVRETLQLSNGTPDDLKEINLTSDFYIGQSDGKRRLNGAISMPVFGQKPCRINRSPSRAASC